jgi:hypothetical protein
MILGARGRSAEIRHTPPQAGLALGQSLRILRDAAWVAPSANLLFLPAVSANDRHCAAQERQSADYLTRINLGGRLLAARYEKLAEYLEAAPETPQLRRQAG